MAGIIGADLTRALTVEQINANQGRGLLQRRFGEVRQVSADARTVSLAFASETPVERWFGSEVLDVTRAAMRLGRITDGAALLLNHDTNRQIGVVENVEIGVDRVARARVRFSRSPEGEAVFQDVVDGIRKHVSVGYLVHDVMTTQRSGQPDIVRVTDWEPYEISIVSVPADATVGVGRSLPETQEASMPKPPARARTNSRELANGIPAERQFAALLQEALEAPGYREFDKSGDGRDVLMIPQPAASIRWFSLSDAMPSAPAETQARQFRLANDGHTPAHRSLATGLSNPAQSQTTTLAAAAIAGSRVLEAGARLIVLQSGAGRGNGSEAGPVFVGEGEPGRRAFGVQEQNGEFIIVEPATFEKPSGEDEEFHTIAGWGQYGEVRRSDLQLFGVNVSTITRSMRFTRGLDQIAAELASAITAGLGRLFDRVLLDALGAASLADGNALSARALGLRFNEVRGLIGTGAAPAAQAIEGRLFLDGVPAEFTDQATSSILGAWDRAALVAHDELTIIASRNNIKGDLDISAHVAVSSLIPDPSYFWKVA